MGGFLLLLSSTLLRCRGAGHEVVGLLVLLGEEDTEERCLEDEDMPTAHQLGEELEEEGNQQQADVHPVVIGIGGDDDAVVAQSL